MPFRAVSRETSTPFGAVLHSNRCGRRCRVEGGPPRRGSEEVWGSLVLHFSRICGISRRVRRDARLEQTRIVSRFRKRCTSPRELQLREAQSFSLQRHARARSAPFGVRTQHQSQSPPHSRWRSASRVGSGSGSGPASGGDTTAGPCPVVPLHVGARAHASAMGCTYAVSESRLNGPVRYRRMPVGPRHLRCRVHARGRGTCRSIPCRTAERGSTLVHSEIECIRAVLEPHRITPAVSPDVDRPLPASRSSACPHWRSGPDPACRRAERGSADVHSPSSGGHSGGTPPGNLPAPADHSPP